MKNLLSTCKGLLSLLAVLLSVSGNTNAQTILADAIPTSYDVSATGAFSYSLPLRIPPGIKDMMPQLAINYNSQGGNSVLGVGWSLSGLSSITRIQPTIYHDQDIQPVKFSATDVFALDGQRMYETSTGVYNTWIKNFAKIESHGTAGNSPDYFTVEYPNGVIYEYGNSTNSKMLADGQLSVFFWALNKVYDRSGNYMEFDYYNDQTAGEYRITKISYTGNINASVSPHTEVNFNYTSRVDKNATWTFGSIVQDLQILENIEIYHDNNFMNKYEFTYNVDMYSHLTKIRELREGNTQLPDININWGNTVTPSLQHSIAVVPNIPIGGDPTIGTGDFNGDGATDFYATPKVASTGTFFDLYLNNKDNTFSKQPSGVPPYSCGITEAVIVDPSATKFMMDVNGDPYDDMVVVTRCSRYPQSGHELNVYFYISNGTGFGPAIPSLKYYNTEAGKSQDWVDNVKILPGDFDGDGKKEVMAMIPSVLNNGSNGWFGDEFDLQIVGDNYSHSGGNVASGNYGYVSGPIFEYVGSIDHPAPMTRVLDFNGDGKDDLMLIDDALILDCEIYNINTTYDAYGNIGLAGGGNSSSLQTISGGIFPSYEHKVIHTGDFNGDGKKDLLTWIPDANPSLPGVWDIAYSTGYPVGITTPGSFYFHSLGLPVPLSYVFTGLEYYQNMSSQSIQNIYVADFNGDGKDDILRLDEDLMSTPRSVKYDIFYSKGFNEFEHEHDDLPFPFQYTTPQFISVGDFNGDGQADIMHHYDIGSAYDPVFLFFHAKEKKHLVTSIEHAGKTLELQYQTLAENNDIYEYKQWVVIPSGSSPDYPYLSRQWPMKVVKDFKDNISLHNTYKYETAITHALGLGFQGFRGMFITDVVKQKMTENWYYNYRESFSLLPTLARSVYWDLATYNGVKNNTMSYPAKTPLFANVYSHPSNLDGGLSGKIRILLPSDVQKTDYVNGTITGRSKLVPGNISAGSMFYEFGVLDGTLESKGDVECSTTYTYDVNAPFYNKAKPITTTTTTINGSKPPYIRVAKHHYNSLGLLDQEIGDEGTANEKITNIAYDPFFGNLTHNEQVAASTTITKDYMYSPDGRFMIQSENTLHYIERFTYDNWGLKTSFTNIDGLPPVLYEYDEVNRIVKTTSPTNEFSTVLYEFATGYQHAPSFNSPQFVVTKGGSSTQFISSTFYDVYGRSLRTAHTGFSGQMIYEDTKYDDKGFLEYNSLPYFQGQNEIHTTFEYDDKDRIKSQAIQGGGATYFTYDLLGSYPPASGMKKTVQDPIQKKETYSYADGATWKIVEDGNNTIEYDYNSNGSLDYSIINGATGLKTEYAYDDFGRLTSKKEPNAGTQTYTYNALEQVTTTNDDKNNFYEFTYDILGRLKTKEGPNNFLYTCVYEDNPNQPETGKLLSETTSNNTSFNYAYDPWGRLEELNESINGELMTSKFTYDNLGRELKHEYPSHDVILNNYDQYGYLESINLDYSFQGLQPQKLWQLLSKNSLGQTVEANYFETNNPNPLYKVERVYNDLGFITDNKLWNYVQNMYVSHSKYRFNTSTADMEMRRDELRNLDENFSYGTYDRLTDVLYSNGNPTLHMQYDDLGNIEKRTDVSKPPPPFNFLFKYEPYSASGGTNPYALTQVPSPVTGTPAYAIPAAPQDVTWTSFKKVATITEGGRNLTFTYGPDDQRSLVEYSMSGTPYLQRYYGKDFERNIQLPGTSTDEYGYVSAEGELVAILAHKVDGPSWLNYVFSDNLGSITHILDNTGMTSGTIVNGIEEERSFDAWGRIRDASNWSYLASSSVLWKYDRGYTGHEHLNDFNIINMNGRLYDPLVGRMFSPDPVVADETNSQAYNKYSYVLNNPLKYTDPTGKFFILPIMFIGGLINFGMHYDQTTNPWQGLGYFAAGAASGAAGYGAGLGATTALGLGGIIGGTVGGAVGGFTGSFISASSNAWISGASFADGVGSGILQGMIGTASGAVMGGIFGGINASKGNRNIWTGEKLGGEDPLLCTKGMGQPYGPTVDDHDPMNFVNSEPQLKKAYNGIFAKNRPDFVNGQHKSFDGTREILAKNLDKDVVWGVTHAPGGNYFNQGKATIYINEYAYNGRFTLYETFSHELNHAAQIADGTIARMLSETCGNLRYVMSYSEVEAYKTNIQTGIKYNWGSDYFQKIEMKINMYKDRMK